MPKAFWSAEQSRKITARVVVEADLVLQTPAHFGNGDGDELTDMPLLIDPLDGKTPLLTGASVAGALRSYLRERVHGYGREADSQSVSVLLFGGIKGDDAGEQSPLIVDDALGKSIGIEMRSSVRIGPISRTAEGGKLFDLELWKAGTVFPLRFELLIREGDNADQLKQALAVALEGFSNGGITLGARKRRGYGQVDVSAWRVMVYDLTKAADLCAWMVRSGEPLDDVALVSDVRTTALNVTGAIDDRRDAFHMRAVFSVDGSLLIRASGGRDDIGPDMVHLHARQASVEEKPILSGTSLGGALRARSLRILKTLGTEPKARALIGSMFGVEMEGDVQPRASRIIVHETVVQNARADLVQNRVSIDRFTGGARETALFSEQPAFGGNDTTVTMDVGLVNPRNHEIGLLLLLLKDLWTSDLSLRGESSIGRGRLKGREATLTYKKDGKEQKWEIRARDGDDTLIITGNRDVLDDYVRKHLKDYFSAESEKVRT